MTKITLQLVLFFLCISFPFLSTAADDKNRNSHLNLTDGIAIQGYDPVSYHLNGPEKGKNDYIIKHAGARYLFASKANLDKFARSPDTYIPAYGGWCAWAMLDGEEVDIDPETYKIVNGRTLLFYNSFFINTLPKWNALAEKETEEALLRKAQAEWMEKQ